MTILIIDTAQPQVWIAVVRDKKVIAEKEWEADRTVGVKLLEVINEITPTPSRSPSGRGRKTSIDRVAVHRGPGHFMSLRAGVVTAQLLAQSWGVELVEVEGNERTEMVREALKAEPVEVVKISYGQTPPAA